jgi:hypothetical protein
MANLADRLTESKNELRTPFLSERVLRSLEEAGAAVPDSDDAVTAVVAKNERA